MVDGGLAGGRDPVVSLVSFGTPRWRCLWIAVLAVSLSACGHSPSTDGRKSSATSYTVRKGDSLYTIAMRYGLSYRQLAALNGIKSPYVIYPGQKLRLRGGSSRARARVGTGSAASSKPYSRAVEGTPAARERKDVTASTLNWRWPTRGKVISRFSATSGKKGIDISGQMGQPVLAAEKGKVVYTGSGLRGYGRLIIIKHNDKYLSAYAHNRKMVVKEGEVVSAGQKIAELGSSGVDRPMLHFEIRDNGRPVDPLRYLP